MEGMAAHRCHPLHLFVRIDRGWGEVATVRSVRPSIREIFLETAQVVVEMVELPAVTRRWNEPSALVGYTVGGLTAHLGRAVSTPLGYLDRQVADRPADTDAADYFIEALGDHDPIESDLHRSVRQRSDDMAASGPLGVADATRDALQSLTAQLEVAPPDRVVVVFGGTAMRLDDYLETRIVEMAIHGDDLAASCPEVSSDAVPASAWAVAKRVASEVAARRVGDREFVLGLSRAERAQRPLAF